MSMNTQPLLPGTSYSTKSEAFRLIDRARDQSVFFIHLDVNMTDKDADRRRVRTFVQVTSDQLKTFIETAYASIDLEDGYDRFRVVVRNVDLGNGVIADSIWIG